MLFRRKPQSLAAPRSADVRNAITLTEAASQANADTVTDSASRAARSIVEVDFFRAPAP